MKDETIAIHAGYQTEPTTKSVATPIYQTVAYEFDNAQHGADLFNLAVPGNIYSRIMNPTNDVLEQRVAALEQGIEVRFAENDSPEALATIADNTVASPVLLQPIQHGVVYTAAMGPAAYIARAHGAPAQHRISALAHERVPALAGYLDATAANGAALRQRARGGEVPRVPYESGLGALCGASRRPLSRLGAALHGRSGVRHSHVRHQGRV